MARIGVITPIKARGDEDVRWLCEGIESVLAQKTEDWQMMIVNDHSEVEFRDYQRLVKLFKDPRVLGKRNEGRPGAATARNLAAELVDANLLLPLDHDDTFPPGAFDIYLEGWKARKPGEGIVYGDTLILQNDSSRIHAGHPYNFNLLLDQLMMPVGALHSKADWGRVGGWKPEMELGLEDWEYWIALGEVGVCGHYIPKVTYHYRRHARGRLAHLRTHPETYARAQAIMKSLHENTYAGRKPMGCCGGPSASTPPAPSRREVSELPAEGLVSIMYVGALGGGFWVVGRRTGINYYVPGTRHLLQLPDGRPGVDPRDVQQLLNQDRGSFVRV